MLQAKRYDIGFTTMYNTTFKIIQGEDNNINQGAWQQGHVNAHDTRLQAFSDLCNNAEVYTMTIKKEKNSCQPSW